MPRSPSLGTIAIDPLTPASCSPESRPQGLSEHAASLRLAEDGFNELPSEKSRGIVAIAISVLREPMFLLLMGTGAVYMLLGEPQEAIPLLAAVFAIIGITFYQERKTENALHALRDLSSPRALVVRDGVRKRISGREVVCGDLVVLLEGDRVPADAVVIEATNLSVDESLLTGESVPVRKTAAPVEQPMERPGGDNLPFVFSGTLVIRGHGIARVLATGAKTELGRIGKALQTLQPENTHLQRETSRLVRVFAVAGIALCAIVAFIYGYTQSNWLKGILAGLTLAISMVPEEFPVVLTIFLAMGAWRISRRRVLARRTPAIESLGSATVLCVDKTGTLTMNRMTVRALAIQDQTISIQDDTRDIPQEFREVIEYSALASSREPVDPMEKALLETVDQAAPERRHRDWTLVKEYPLSPNLFAMSNVWSASASSTSTIAAKGAPEAIAELCKLSPDHTREVLAATAKLAAKSLRVLGVAKATLASALPAQQRQFPFKFIGLVGLADPVRPSVPAAVQECYKAGVRIVMITGDYPLTAQNIAAEIGLRHPEETITGAELAKMSDQELSSRIRTVNIFARMIPEQKLRLVNALKANGETVAMTGDGVNDAPALKAADIGIAMGARGTDVAREAAAMVLLDDDFSSMVGAIRLGRRIYDNLKKATSYLLAIHMPIAGIALVPVLFRWPLVLFPLHVLFLELIIDPTSSIAFEAEPEESDVMSRPPRDPKEPLFTTRRVILSLLQGITVLGSVLAVYGMALYLGHEGSNARALAFATLIVGNLALIFTNRSWTRTIWQTLRSHNSSLWWVTASALLLLLIVVYTPALQKLFLFSPLRPGELAIAFGAGILGVFWFEVLKLATVRANRRPGQQGASG